MYKKGLILLLSLVTYNKGSEFGLEEVGKFRGFNVPIVDALRVQTGASPSTRYYMATTQEYQNKLGAVSFYDPDTKQRNFYTAPTQSRRRPEIFKVGSEKEGGECLIVEEDRTDGEGEWKERQWTKYIKPPGGMYISQTPDDHKFSRTWSEPFVPILTFTLSKGSNEGSFEFELHGRDNTGGEYDHMVLVESEGKSSVHVYQSDAKGYVDKRGLVVGAYYLNFATGGLHNLREEFIEGTGLFLKRDTDLPS